MLPAKLKNVLIDIVENPFFRRNFSLVTDPDTFRKAKLEENIMVLYSNEYFERFQSDGNFSPKIDKKYGDFRSIDGDYFDLKVGDENTGAISYSSLYSFGDTHINHYYICVNKKLTRCYLIDASRLLKFMRAGYISKNKKQKWFGEKDYKHLCKRVYTSQRCALYCLEEQSKLRNAYYNLNYTLYASANV